jgi:HSP20 family protein
VEATDGAIAAAHEAGVERCKEVSEVLTLDRWTPLRELDRMERRMRRLFEDRGLFAFEAPATDVYETDMDFVVELEVPGFDREELTVEVSDHTLVVKGEHEEEADKAGRELLLHERLERRFERRFELPVEVDAEQVVAECDKGVLTLHVPKTGEKAEPRTIEITTP